MAVPSKRTWVAASKPEPKICTPLKSVVDVRVPCGTVALGMPPITPSAGLGLGTRISVICVGLRELSVLGQVRAELQGPRLMTSIWPLPDITTKAWLVTGSTARPPKSARELVVPFATVSVAVPVPTSVVWELNVCWSVGFCGLTRHGVGIAFVLHAKAYRLALTGSE